MRGGRRILGRKEKIGKSRDNIFLSPNENS